MRILIVIGVMIFVASCGGNDGTQKQESPEQKLPFEVKSPWGASYETSEYGDMTAFTIRKDGSYAVQVIASPAESDDVRVIRDKQLQMVNESPYFRRILLNEPNGFIFEMMVDSSRHYDFRLVKLKDSTQYIFQTELTKLFSEGQARLMYESVK